MRRLFAGLAEVEHCRWFRRFVLLHASTVPQNQHNAIHKTTNACAVITPAPYPSAASRLSCRVRCRLVSSQAVPSCGSIAPAPASRSAVRESLHFRGWHAWRCRPGARVSFRRCTGSTATAFLAIGKWPIKSTDHAQDNRKPGGPLEG